MLVSTIKEEELTYEVVDRLLYSDLEDTGEAVDCIIVLGSIKASKYRVPVAVDAYTHRRASKVLLCGGKLRDFPDGCYSEAEHMRKTALELGIAKENIILENTSQNTVDNIRFALIELQKVFCLS